MPDYLIHGPRDSDVPHAMSYSGRRIGAAPTDDEIVLAGFPAPTWDAAMAIYRDCRDRGIDRVLASKHNPPQSTGSWSFPGAAGYLEKAAVRLGMSISSINKAEQESIVRGISGATGDVYSRYRKIKGPGKPDREFTVMELRDVRAILDGREAEDARIHAMAAACRSMLDDARSACGLEARDRPYRVVGPRDAEVGRLVAENDRLRGVIERSTRCVEIAVSEREEMKVELDRLRVEDESLAGQLTSPVPDVPTGEPASSKHHNRRTPAKG